MKLKMFSVILSLLFAFSAHAGSGEQRVLVFLKDKHSLDFMKGQFKTAVSDMRVESSLENLNALVVVTKSEAAIERLKGEQNVTYVEKEYFHPAPAPIGGFAARPSDIPGPKTPWGIVAVKAPLAWDKSKQGEGARVLVLDTGIDKDHPALKDNFEAGQNFTGAGSDFSDTIGHGTHVSGTIAAARNDETGFSGVAPKAKLLMGRVCSGIGCSSVAIVEGINWGISKKVDVISMSLGGLWSTAGERDAIAKADRAGLTVVAASGNSGTDSVGYPAALPTVVAVGAVDEKLVRATFSQYGPELALVAPGVNVVSTVPRGTGREASVLVDMGQGCSNVKASTFQGGREVLTAETVSLVPAGLGKPDDFKGLDLKGKYALVRRGEITFGDKAKNAYAAGATGVLIYNNEEGLIEGTLTTDGSTLPAAAFMVEKVMGEQMLAKVQAGVDVKITVQTLATDYQGYQGTSMATPHVAGVAALVKAANKNLTGAQVKDILKRTATPLGPNSHNEYGSGLVNAEAAVNAALQLH